LRSVIYLILWVIGLYVAISAYVYIFQSRYLYFPNIPTRELQTTPADIGYDYDDVTIRTADDQELNGWFIQRDTPRGTVLFFHGNAGNISHRLDSIAFWHQQGFEVFIFDYRGYGRSNGTPSEAGTYQDGRAAWEYLLNERGADPKKIVIFGRSLGAAIAARTASENSPGALILESVFSSVADMGRRYYPWLLVRWITRLHYDTAALVSQIDSPILVIHSRDDEIIPFDQGRKVFEQARQPKEFLEIIGDHNGGFILSGSLYRDGVGSFLDRNFPVPTSAPVAVN